MANQEQLKILKKGVEVWNKWRKNNPDVEIDLVGANLKGLYLSRAMLARADLFEANLMEADLSFVDLAEAILARTDLIRANLSGADLRNANFSEADLSEANLSDANLVSAILAVTDLKDANLARAKLILADLNWAVLTRADLRAADLRNANLTDADLRKANLMYADLLEANLMNVDLKETNLTSANLIQTDFTDCIIGYTILVNNDLGGSFGLETIMHTGPSMIGTDTIRKSKGKIPVEFLRGCGLSDFEIEQAKLASPGLDPEQVTQIAYEIHRLYLGQPIQFYSCFISYNNKDHGFAKHLHDDLQNNGVRCWLATEDLKIGDPIRPTIDREIRLRDKLLVILSEASIHSEWVGDEVEAAIEEESTSNRLVLFPIRLDNAVMNTRDDWGAKIKRRRHIGDFSNWQDERYYRQAFERLLRDLKAQETSE